MRDLRLETRGRGIVGGWWWLLLVGGWWGCWRLGIGDWSSGDEREGVGT